MRPALNWMVERMSLAAIGADGLIIEVHNNRRRLCDGAQSLTPDHRAAGRQDQRARADYGAHPVNGKDERYE